MDIKNLAPWNWFKKEEEQQGKYLPVDYGPSPTGRPENSLYSPFMQLHREVDRLFDNAFRAFGSPSLHLERPFNSLLTASGLLSPQVNIGANDKEYAVTVEVPGVDEKEVKVEIVNNTMIIKGEKKQEAEEKNKNYYRIERSYGSFQRVLSLPEDADQENVKASFKKGVLTVTMPRKALPARDVKQIEIKSD
jgi:HSP20 family protein